MKSLIPDNILPSLNSLGSKCPISFPIELQEPWKILSLHTNTIWEDVFGKLKKYNLIAVLGGQ